MMDLATNIMLRILYNFLSKLLKKEIPSKGDKDQIPQ